jgi:hypothetical protein
LRCPASFSLSLNTVSTVNAIRLVYSRKLGDASFMGDLLKLIWWAVIKLFRSRRRNRHRDSLRHVERLVHGRGNRRRIYHNGNRPTLHRFVGPAIVATLAASPVVNAFSFSSTLAGPMIYAAITLGLAIPALIYVLTVVAFGRAVQRYLLKVIENMDLRPPRAAA